VGGRRIDKRPTSASGGGRKYLALFRPRSEEDILLDRKFPFETVSPSHIMWGGLALPPSGERKT